MQASRVREATVKIVAAIRNGPDFSNCSLHPFASNLCAKRRRSGLLGILSRPLTTAILMAQNAVSQLQRLLACRMRAGAAQVEFHRLELLLHTRVAKFSGNQQPCIRFLRIARYTSSFQKKMSKFFLRERVAALGGLPVPPGCF